MTSRRSTVSNAHVTQFGTASNLQFVLHVVEASGTTSTAHVGVLVMMTSSTTVIQLMSLVTIVSLVTHPPLSTDLLTPPRTTLVLRRLNSV